MAFKYYFVILAIISILACSKSTEPENDAPDDHTVSIEGVRHKSGLNNPDVNCVACHGQLLDGGSAGVSCFDCHGKKWQ